MKSDNEIKLVYALNALLSICERLKSDTMDNPIVWDDKNPTIYYLKRNMEIARKVLENEN